MVQAIDNRALLDGIVVGIERGSGAARMRLRVTSARPVDGYAFVVRAEEGQTIDVTMPEASTVEVRTAGEPVTIAVRMTGPGRYVAMPDDAVEGAER